MSDVNVLYAVTAVVLAGLLVWAGIVLATNEDAPDESPEEEAGRPDLVPDRKSVRPVKAAAKATPIPDETPPPATVDVSGPSERAVAIAGKPSPVVVMPEMRSRLDSHSEISDGSRHAEEPAAPAAGGLQEKGQASDSVMPPGPPFSLVSAIGRSEPARGPTEMSAIVDRHHLFILADGGGQRIKNELVSSIVADALTAAFEVGADASYPAHATLPRRADRLRRSVIAALTVLASRGKDEGLEMSRVGVLAAHFTPDNRKLYVATVGPDRAYRMRAQDLVHLNRTGLGQRVDDGVVVEIVSGETAPDDVYVFGSDKAFLALGDELRAVLMSDPSIDRVAAHFVDAATRDGKSTGMTAIVVRVNPPRASMRPPAV